MRHQVMDRRVLLGLQGQAAQGQAAAPGVTALSRMKVPQSVQEDQTDYSDVAWSQGRDRSAGSISKLGQAIAADL